MKSLYEEELTARGVAALERIAEALLGETTEENVELDATFDNGQIVQVFGFGTDEPGFGWNGKVGTIEAKFWKQERHNDAIESFRVRFEDDTVIIAGPENLRLA